MQPGAWGLSLIRLSLYYMLALAGEAVKQAEELIRQMDELGLELEAVYADRGVEIGNARRAALIGKGSLSNASHAHIRGMLADPCVHMVDV